MNGQIMKKVVQNLKRPKEEWYFNTTPKPGFERFYYLLDLACAINYSESRYFDALLFGEYYEEEDYKPIDRETAWRKFQNEIELKFGLFYNESNDSCSMLATMDDNPGTGRLIDKFVYQPIGRSSERLFLNLELRYFHPPEKSACQIKRFLEGSLYFGKLIPVDRISYHEFQNYNTFGKNVDFNKVCVSLFMEISRKKRIANAFQRLLLQASSKDRGLRVKAQKQIWSLFRYENMVFILKVVTDFESLIWDGYTTTFQHCSPLDPDFQTHFSFIGDMMIREVDTLVVMSAISTRGILRVSMKEIFETCARKNRGFSSLPITLVIKLFKEELNTYTLADHEDQKLEGTEEFAENLYLASIAIIGFCNEFRYPMDFFSMQLLMRYNRRAREPPVLLPLWGKDRTETDINALELMVHFMIYLLISFPRISSRPEAVAELEYYIALLNGADKGQGTMSKLEARASVDYLQKVNEVLVHRGPISFTMFKDIVTNPVIWEEYHRPERPTEAIDKSRVPTKWNYVLHFDAAQSVGSSILHFHYIPFSKSFGPEQLNSLFLNTRCAITREDFAGKVLDSWFQIQKWLKELKDDSMELPLDKPGTKLYEVMSWWSSYDIHKEMSPIAQEVPRKESLTQPFLRRGVETTALPSPCQCGICMRSLHVPDKETADFSSQHRRQHNTATESSPLPSRSGFLKRKLEELEPRPQTVPLPRRYRDNTAEDTEPGSSLGPVRKKQRTSLSLESDTSDADAIITDSEVDEGSTESDTGSEDGTSVDEDFWSAKSKLSLLAIED